MQADRERSGALVARLEALGRSRALTEVESLLLERSIAVVDGRRIPRHLTQMLARHGIGRSMYGPHRHVMPAGTAAPAQCRD